VASRSPRGFVKAANQVSARWYSLHGDAGSVIAGIVSVSSVRFGLGVGGACFVGANHRLHVFLAGCHRVREYHCRHLVTVY